MSKVALTVPQKYAIKLAINIMSRNFKRYCMYSYGNRETGVRVDFGEALNILNDMVKE